MGVPPLPKLILALSIGAVLSGCGLDFGGSDSSDDPTPTQPEPAPEPAPEPEPEPSPEPEPEPTGPETSLEAGINAGRAMYVRGIGGDWGTNSPMTFDAETGVYSAILASEGTQELFKVADEGWDAIYNCGLGPSSAGTVQPLEQVVDLFCAGGYDAADVGMVMDATSYAFFFRYMGSEDNETGAAQLEVVEAGDQGLDTAVISRAKAHWISSDTLVWDYGRTEISTAELRYDPDGGMEVSAEGVSESQAITLTPGASLSAAQQAQFPHLRGLPVFTVDGDMAQKVAALQGEMVAVAFDDGGTPVKSTYVQFGGVLDDMYAYDGELGAIKTDAGYQLRVWAPTALSVKLHVFDASKTEVAVLEPDADAPAAGVYQFSGGNDWNGQFYQYEVEVYHPVNGRINTFMVTDPYSVSLSTDSQYSQIIDLTDPALMPAGWDALVKTLPEHKDISLYEGHVRDFSISDESVAAEHRGKYLAFTYNGVGDNSLSTGMQHLIALQQAGLTHMHLQPPFDIGSVPEAADRQVNLSDPFNRLCEKTTISNPDDCETYGEQSIQSVFEQWAAADPATPEIQRISSAPGRLNGFASVDSFNWGYDPYHYNVPEGSYATTPEGTARILEFRQMVKGLADVGINTVIDVVYNHTIASGVNTMSVLDKVVPRYYHRLNESSGEVETSTCCDNTAAEMAMMEKLIVDSIVLWAKHYKVDSFRFDLMGHYPLSTMQKVQAALAELTPEADGVDGSKIYIYGEGWNFGEIANNRRFTQATQGNLAGTGIGSFNDRIRTAVRGPDFQNGQDQGFGNGLFVYPNGVGSNSKSTLLSQGDTIRVSLAGNMRDFRFIDRNGNVQTGSGNGGNGYTDDPQENVNYIDKHDNESLFDNTQAKLPADMSMADRVRVHNLNNAFINFGQGVPFYMMGSDILRSKSLDRNSFDSGDWFNFIDFSLEQNGWGRGLPLAWDNSSRFSTMTQLLNNQNINPQKADMQAAHAAFVEQLQIRYGSALFRLDGKDDVMTRVNFNNTGPDQVPAVIAMSISDGSCAGADLDPNVDGVMVIINADDDPITLPYTGADGFVLNSIQANGSDEIAKGATFSDGAFQLPGLTYAVFEKPQNGAQGEFPCNTN